MDKQVTKRAAEPTPLQVARAAAKAAGTAARVAADEANRQRPPEEALPPATSEEAELEDELAALHAHLSTLQAGAQRVRMDIYLMNPLPPGFKHQLYLDRLEDFRTVENLEQEIARKIQARGRWGPMEVRLSSKLCDPDTGVWRYLRHDMLGLDVERTEAAVQAATQATAPATAAGSLNPIDAAKTMLEVGRTLGAPAGAAVDPTESLMKLLALAKELGVLPQTARAEDLLGKLTLQAPSLLGALREVLTFLRPQDTGAQLLATITALKDLGLIGRPEKSGNMQDLLAVAELILDRAPGGGEGRSTWVETMDLLGRHFGPGVERFGEALLEHVRQRQGMPAGARPGVAAGAPALPAMVAQIQRELDEAALRLNDGYFPRLAERLRTAFEGGRGADFLEAIRAGQVTDLVAFDTFTGVGFRLDEPLRRYLTRFLNWLRQQGRGRPAPRGAEAPAAAAAPPNGAGAAPRVVGRCERCGATYDYPDEASLTAEGLCEPPCGGRIVRVLETTTT